MPTHVLEKNALRPAPVIPGRQWITHFEAGMAVADNAVWNLTNLTRVMDGARPAAQMTSLAAPALCMTKEMVRDVDVLVRWRLADTEDVYNIGFAQMAAHARWVAKGNRISFDYDIWHLVAYPVALTNGDALDLGVNQTGGFDPAVTFAAIDNTNVATDRYLRIRVVGGAVFVKQWFANVDEPDWQQVRLARGENSPTLDNIESGFAGVEMLYNGGFLYEVVVTELLPTAEMVVEGRMAPTDTITGIPVGWSRHGAVGAGTTTVDNPVVVDPWGTPRKVLHINKPAAGGYDGAGLRLYNARRRGQVYTTRRSPDPYVSLPSMVRVSVWSKANNVLNPSPSQVKLGSAAVLYYYDSSFTPQNQVDSQYYRALGPTNYPNPPLETDAPGVGGIGTWDWFQTTWVMPIYGADDIYWVDLFVGLHDPGATGELWVSDFSIVPVLT